MREQAAYFASIGQDFEWKVYAHDSPAELGELLVGLGFEPEPEEIIVYLDLTALPENLTASSTANVERVVDPLVVDEIIAMMKSVWNEDFSDLASSLKAELKGDAEHLGIYVVRNERRARERRMNTFS